MPRTASSRPTPEDILSGHAPEVRAIAERLRALVRAVLPDAEERAYPGWHAIGYRHPAAGYIGAIFPLADHVKLGFEHGARLPDPGGVLTGEGKQVRYVELHQGDDLNEQAVRSLLLDAVALRAR